MLGPAGMGWVDGKAVGGRWMYMHVRLWGVGDIADRVIWHGNGCSDREGGCKCENGIFSAIGMMK